MFRPRKPPRGGGRCVPTIVEIADLISAADELRRRAAISCNRATSFAGRYTLVFTIRSGMVIPAT